MRQTRFLFGQKNFFNNILVEHINDFTKKNLKYLDNIVITINNPQKVSKSNIFYTHIFEAELIFEKSDMSLSKKIKNDNVENLFVDIQKFIESEIKI